MKIKWFWYLVNCLYPPTPYDRLISVLSYEDFVTSCPFSSFSSDTYSAILPFRHKLGKALVYSLKFSNSSHAAAICARLLADKIHTIAKAGGEARSVEIISPEIIVIPLPSSKQRLREKGFNQCFTISKHLTHLLDKNIQLRTNIIYKHRHTSRQALSRKEDRLINLQDCFIVHEPELIAGKHIILFDDVVTTGATFEAALDCLRKAGAHATGIAIAH